MSREEGRQPRRRRHSHEGLEACHGVRAGAQKQDGVGKCGHHPLNFADQGPCRLPHADGLDRRISTIKRGGTVHAHGRGTYFAPQPRRLLPSGIRHCINSRVPLCTVTRQKKARANRTTHAKLETLSAATTMGKILLCDDEESLCRSLGRVLRAAGHEVVAHNGEQGLTRLREERFDLILTDIRMPEVSGFEILAAARLHAPGTPVIAMSGSAEIPDAVRAMHAGARDFLIKPFETRTLEEAVSAVLRPQPPEPEPDAMAWRDQHAPW